MNDSEHRIQVNCVRYFRYQFPDKIIFAIPNGSVRNIITARRLKDEGVLAGVPDLYIAEPNGDWAGLFIEMKNGKAGRVSENQQEVMTKLTSVGYKCAVVRSFEEFVAVVKDYFGESELHERIEANRDRAMQRIAQATIEAKRSYEAQTAYEQAICGTNLPINNDKLNYIRDSNKTLKNKPKCDTQFILKTTHKPTRKTIVRQEKPCDC